MIPNFLISRLASSPFNALKNNPKSQLTHLIFFNSLAPQLLKDHNFTISFLVSSCGLSPEIAVTVSQKVHFKNADKPNVVLALLRNYGFSESQIAELVQKRPSMLLNAEKTLLPKLEFFKSIGLSPNDLPKLATKNQQMLFRSLKNCLIPRYNAIKSVVRDDWVIVRALKRTAIPFLCCDVANNFVPNVESLKHAGVPQRSISHMVIFYPGQAFMKNERFVVGVKLAMEMGFDPHKVSFVTAVMVLLHLDEVKMESKMSAFEKWGWSREVTLSAFKKYPIFMKFTEGRIHKTMMLFVEDMGWPSEDVARFPKALGYSLEKRVVPRCNVLKALKSKGLIKGQPNLSSIVDQREEIFLKRYVIKFQEEMPLLMKVYRGLVDYKDVL